MIADIILKNDDYYVYDEKGRQIKCIPESAYGELLGFNGDFEIFLNNDSYYIYDKEFRLISTRRASPIGDFIKILPTGAFQFTRDGITYEYDEHFGRF